MRAALVSIVLAVATVAVPVSAQAIAQSYHLNIPRQPLDGALKDLAQQTGLQIARFSDTPGGSALVGPLSGDMSVDQALTSLLKMSGLTYKVVNDRTIAVMLPGADPAAAASTQASGTDQASPPTSDNSKEGKKDSSDQFRVAQVDQGQTSSPSTVEKSSEQLPKKQPVLEEVIVTGSRIPTTAAQQVQPVQSFTRDDMLQSGQTTVATFLNTLPDVSLSSDSSGARTFLGQATVQLHGLPIGTTLVLLNGRRVEDSSTGFFDLNSLPASAVERIDVLPIGGSAVYGSDALGGTVNIVLRTNFTGVEVNAKITHADELTERDADFALGKSWDRGSISLLGNYQDLTGLLGLDRAATSSVTAIPPAADPLLTWDICAPGTVYSLNGQNLPGLSAPEASIPAGISGVPTIGDFVGTAGRTNQCRTVQYESLTAPVTRFGGLLSGHYALSDSADLFLEVLGSHSHQEFASSPLIMPSFTFFGSTLGANNPYNPFGEAVGISFAYPGMLAVFDDTEDLVRPLVGVRGALFGSWHYEVTAYVSRDRRLATIPSGETAITAGTGLVENALQSPNPATALNPFTSGPPGSAALLQSLEGVPQIDSYVNETNEAEAVLRGPLFDLPAGAVQAVGGAQFAHDSEKTFSNAASVNLDLARRSSAVFAETQIPILGSTGHLDSGNRLTATLAGRYDHSNDFGGKASWQAGLLWTPTESLSIRSGYGTSYRAPLLQEIGGGVQASFQGGGYVDPFRGGQPVTLVDEIIAANPNLKPETGDSFALGASYSESAFQTSLTFFSVSIANYIAIPNEQTLIDYPSLFPGGIERAPPTPQDLQKGWLGQITQINDLYFNFGDLHVAGVDGDARYTFATRVGDLVPSVALADVVRWRAALSPGLPEVSYLSQATELGPGFAPRWKGTVALAWKLQAWSASVTGRYIGRYRDYQDFVPNNNELGNFWLCDFNARYEIGRGLSSNNAWLSGASITLGAINILNTTPQFSYSSVGYDPAEADIRGRIVYLGVGLKW